MTLPVAHENSMVAASLKRFIMLIVTYSVDCKSRASYRRFCPRCAGVLTPSHLHGISSGVPHAGGKYLLDGARIIVP